MNRAPALNWWHAFLASTVVTIALLLLVQRIDTTLPRWFLQPPKDGVFTAYPLLTLAFLSVAYWRRSIQLVLLTQSILFVIGFLHIMWIAGTIPTKVDLRFIFVAMTAHAVLWASGLCALAAVAVGLRRP